MGKIEKNKKQESNQAEETSNRIFAFLLNLVVWIFSFLGGIAQKLLSERIKTAISSSVNEFTNKLKPYHVEIRTIDIPEEIRNRSVKDLLKNPPELPKLKS